MCTAFFRDGILSRTADRTGNIEEHYIIGRENYTGGVIRNAYGEIWIDGINTSGLTAALLNYRKSLSDPCRTGAARIHPGKLIPILLAECTNMRDVRRLLNDTELTADEPEMYPHFIIGSAGGACIVFEDGRIYENPWGVLTNAPSFSEQIRLLERYTDQNHMIPGDYSSESRFARMHSLCRQTTGGSIADAFARLCGVSVPLGADPREGYRTVLRTVMSAHDMSYSFAEGCAGRIRKVGVGGAFEISAKGNEF